MQNIIEETRFLTEITARALLKKQGYDMTCPFGHVHATQGNRQWHLCMHDALATMDATHLLTCLNNALHVSQNVPGQLLPLVETSGGRA